jgi:hypothetical protein
MAGDWIKWTKGLTKKREVGVLASKLGRDRHEVAGRLMTLWEWCDDNLYDSDYDQSGNASVVIGDKAFVDEMVGLSGFADALASPEVAWLVLGDGGRITFPKFDNHNGNTAKNRLYEQKKKANQRKEALKTSLKCPDETGTTEGTKIGTRREETRGDERREESSNRERPNGQPPKKVSLSKAGKEPVDLAGLDWSHVMSMVQSLAKRVPPFDRSDRRMWFRFGIMAELEFSEHWLLDAAEAVVRAESHKKTPQAHLVAVLKSKAAEEGMPETAFRELLNRIEVPADVWKSDLMKVAK